MFVNPIRVRGKRISLFSLPPSAFRVREFYDGLMKPEKINCFQCQHFFITWDKKFPRGCRALGFKSREMPHLMVRQASGMKCLKFEKRDLAAKSK